MDVRLLTAKEAEKVCKVIRPAGLCLSGGSYSDGKYDLEITPERQVTRKIREAIEKALETEEVTINGIVRPTFDPAFD